MEQEYIKGDIVMYDNKVHIIMDSTTLESLDFEEDSVDEDTGEVIQMELDLDKLHKHHKEQEAEK